MNINSIKKRFSEYSFFQRQVLELLLNELDAIHESLHQDSVVSVEKKLVTLTFIHKDDINTILTFNVFRQYLSLWYTECNYSVTSFDREWLIQVIRYLLGGKYIAEEYYRDTKKLYSIVRVEDSILPDAVIYYSLLFQIIKSFGFKDNSVRHIVKYSNFYNVQNLPI